MTKLLVVLLVLGSSVVRASPLNGEDARQLSTALKYAGVKPTVAKSAVTYRVGKIYCVVELGKDKALGEHTCTLDKTEVKDAAAYLLDLSIAGIGMVGRVETDTRISTTGTNLTCVVDPTAKRYDDGFVCTWDNMPPDKITPKKKAVKDIVQPVKIEKKN